MVQDALDAADAAISSSSDVTKEYRVLSVTHEETERPYTYTILLSQPPNDQFTHDSSSPHWLDLFKFVDLIVWAVAGVLLWLVVSLLLQGMSNILQVRLPSNQILEGNLVGAIDYIVFVRRRGSVNSITLPLLATGFLISVIYSFDYGFGNGWGSSINTTFCGIEGALSSWSLAAYLNWRSGRPISALVLLLAAVAVSGLFSTLILSGR